MTERANGLEALINVSFVMLGLLDHSCIPLNFLYNTDVLFNGAATTPSSGEDPCQSYVQHFPN